MEVKFVDLGRQYETLREEILDAVDRISRKGAYVLGEELEAFEKEIAAYCNCKYAIGLGSGSDALILPLRCLDIGPGDEVITAPNSFIATAWTIAHTGARIVFADVDESMNLEPRAVETALTPRTRAIMPVHLTGRIANVERLHEIAVENDALLVEDAAQAIGAKRNSQSIGTYGRFAGVSLHPLKILHVQGDGGICLTNDESLKERLLKMRNHGLADRDTCTFWGVNSRLDEIQAAIGRIKLKHLDNWIARIRRIAAYYRSELSEHVSVPSEYDDEMPVYHRFMIRTSQRDALQRHLAQKGVGAAVNYPSPLHLQPAARSLGYKEGDFPQTERLAKTILSLPLYPEITDDEANYVVTSVNSFFR